MKKIYTLLFFAFSGMLAIAQPAGWGMTQKFYVIENSGAQVLNYQLKLYINTQAEIAAGNMNANGDDIRFAKDCPGTLPLNFWIEGPMNDDSTVIWVKIDTLASLDTMVLYMFFKNPSATSASAIPGTFIGPHSSTDSVASGGAGGVGNSQRGFRFTANTDILLYAFGKREPTGTTRYVTLFAFPSGTQLRQMQVSGPAAQYSYAPLTNPLWLVQGNQYVIELFQGVGDGYYFGTSSQIGQHLTYGDMRYCNSCTQNTFPTSTLSNYHYGYPDFWYFTRNVMVNPPTYIPGPPSLSVDAQDASVCSGADGTLTSVVTNAIGSWTCTWSPSFGLSNASDCNPTASLSSDTTYQLTVVDSLGCNSSDSASVFVLPLPVILVSPDTSVICSGDSVAMTVSGGTSWSWSPSGSIDHPDSSSVIAFPDSSTWYSVTGTDSSGCSDSSLAYVMVNPLPVLIANPNPAGFCEGDSVSITVSGADTWSWSPTSGLDNPTASTVIANPTVSTVYLVTGVDTSGCESTLSVQVNVNAIPTVTFTTLGVICSDDPAITMNTGSPAGGTYSGTGVSGNQFDPVAAGAGTHVLTYTFTDSSGCTSSDTIHQIVSVCVGIHPATTWVPSVYPNPNTGSFVIEIPANAGRVEALVVSLTGQVIMDSGLDAGANRISMENFANGIYFLLLQSEAGVFRMKIEVQR